MAALNLAQSRIRSIRRHEVLHEGQSPIVRLSHNIEALPSEVLRIHRGIEPVRNGVDHAQSVGRGAAGHGERVVPLRIVGRLGREPALHERRGEGGHAVLFRKRDAGVLRGGVGQCGVDEDVGRDELVQAVGVLDREGEGGGAAETDAEDRADFGDVQGVQEDDDVVRDDGEVQGLVASLETISAGVCAVLSRVRFPCPLDSKKRANVPYLKKRYSGKRCFRMAIASSQMRKSQATPLEKTRTGLESATDPSRR